MSVAGSDMGVIVIVDDDQTIGFLLQRVLREIAPAYDVVFAQHGAGAIVQIDSRYVRLVIVDYHIGDVTGAEVTREIKARSPHTKVLAFSGMSDRHIEGAFMEAGADFFLQKPITLVELRGALRHLFTATNADLNSTGS